MVQIFMHMNLCNFILALHYFPKNLLVNTANIIIRNRGFYRLMCPIKFAYQKYFMAARSSTYLDEGQTKLVTMTRLQIMNI